MKIHKGDIKAFIIILIICAICALCVIFFSKKSNYENLISINDYGEFFSITNCVNKYINYVSNKNSEATFSLLDKEYKDEKLITSENIFNKIVNFDKDLSLSTVNIKYTNIDDNTIYYVNGEFIKNTFESSEMTGETLELLVLVDNKNSLYSIYPIDDDLKKSINNIKKISIESNNYNYLNKSDTITKERMCSFYLSNYYLLLNHDLEKAYSITSSKMKIKYSNYDAFKKYIEYHINDLSSTADKCKLDEYDDSRVYSVIDKNNNKFTFKESGILNYEVDISINS